MNAILIALLVAAALSLMAGIEWLYDRLCIPDLCGRCHGTGAEVTGKPCIMCGGDGRPWR